MENEVWKDVEGYETLYQVSDLGRIKSLSRIQSTRKIISEEIIMVGYIKPNGYKTFTLHKDKKKTTFLIHQIVAKAFIPNPDNRTQINHKDGNPLNNNIDNLEWCTQSENNFHAYRVLGKKAHFLGKVTPKAKQLQQLDLNGNLIKEWESISKAAKSLNIDRMGINDFCNGKSKHSSYKGFIWKT